MPKLHLEQLKDIKCNEELWITITSAGIGRLAYLMVLAQQEALKVTHRELERMRCLRDPARWNDETHKTFRVRIGRQFNLEQFAVAVQAGVSNVQLGSTPMLQPGRTGLATRDTKYYTANQPSEIVSLVQVFALRDTYHFAPSEIYTLLNVGTEAMSYWSKSLQQGRTSVRCHTPGVRQRLTVMYEILAVLTENNWPHSEILSWWQASSDALEGKRPAEAFAVGRFESVLNAAKSVTAGTVT